MIKLNFITSKDPFNKHRLSVYFCCDYADLWTYLICRHHATPRNKKLTGSGYHQTEAKLKGGLIN